VRKPREEVSSARKRADGRRQILMYMKPDVIRELKRAALTEERPAFEIAEEAVLEWLKKNKRKS
jgi:hypothetical protein